MYPDPIIFDFEILFAPFFTLPQVDLDLKILFELILDLNAHVLTGTCLPIDFGRFQFLPCHIERFDTVVDKAAKALNRPDQLLSDALNKRESSALEAGEPIVILLLHNH